MARQVELEAVITAKDKASKTLTKFQSNARSFAKGFDRAVVGSLVAGGAAATLFAKKSVDAFMAQENAVSRLEAGLKNVGDASENASKKLIEQAISLQGITRFGDEAIISAQGILTTFQMNSEAIATLTPRLLDMAEGVRKVSGETVDLEQISIAMGKAMTMGAGALSRYGVVLTETQREQFNQAEGMEKAVILAEILDDNYQGLAEAAGTTLAGQIDILKNALGDLQEVLGEMIAEELEPIIKDFSDWAQSDQTAKMIEEWVQTIKDGIPVAIDWIKRMWKWAVKLVNFFKTGWGKVILATVAIVVTTIAAAGGSIIASFVFIVGTIALVIKAVQRLAQSFDAKLMYMEAIANRAFNRIRFTMMNLRRSVLGVWNGVIGKVKNVWGRVTNIISGAVSYIKTLVSGMWSSIKGSLPSPVQNILSAMGYQSGGIVDQTGIAMVHEGEKVIPKGAHAGSGGDGVTINVYGNVNAGSQEQVENFGRTVARQFKLNQMGAS